MADVREVTDINAEQVVKSWIEELRLKREELTICSKANIRIDAMLNNAIVENRILLSELTGNRMRVGERWVGGLVGWLVGR
jgi:hypothetical protein